MKTSALVTASVLAIAAAGTASAAVEATAATDLNLRAGPGSQYVIDGVIAADDTVTVEGCEEESNWCKVSYNGKTGWAYGDYLTATTEADETVAVDAPDANLQLGPVIYQETSDTTGRSIIAGGGTGAAAGALIAGPVGAAVGAAIGGTMGGLADPGKQVVTYVVDNPVDPVFLQGEAVVGAKVPQDVTLVNVPDSEFSYLYLNGQPVVIDTESRQIVRIVR